jgi:cytochrome c556
MLERSEAESKSLEEALHGREGDLKKIDAHFARVTADCAACHQKYRDIPLKEKATTK